MSEVICVRVDGLDELFYISPCGKDYKKGTLVVFDYDGVTLLGEIIKEKFNEDDENLLLPLNEVTRVAGRSDIRVYNKNKEVEKKALADARKISASLGLDMNFISCCFYFDKSQLLLYFISENRVDFRDLAKKLASKYKTRIELRQVGIRDKAKKVGGLGPCGLFLCCNSFLTDFISVSINMAKNQMLALNPNKISGICGRLLCCLSYENDTYNELKKDLPPIGLMMDTPLGMGKVVSLDIFNQTYSVDLGDKGIVVCGKERRK